MAASFVAAGSGLATTTTTLSLVAPAVINNDVLFALIVSNNNTAVVAPGDWTLVSDTVNTAAMRTYLGYRRIGDSASGATFAFTVGGTTLSFGVIVAYRGCMLGGAVIGSVTSSANASSDNVTYATLLPGGPNRLLVAFGAYNLNATTAGAFSGTDPTFTQRVDIETATGNTASLFVHDGPSLTNIATGSRTLVSASTVDAINHGYMLDLVDAQLPSGNGGPSTNLIRTRFYNYV